MTAPSRTSASIGDTGAIPSEARRWRRQNRFDRFSASRTGCHPLVDEVAATEPARARASRRSLTKAPWEARARLEGCGRMRNERSHVGEQSHEPEGLHQRQHAAKAPCRRC